MHRLASISVSNPQGSPSYLRGAQPLNIQPNLPSHPHPATVLHSAPCMVGVSQGKGQEKRCCTLVGIAHCMHAHFTLSRLGLCSSALVYIALSSLPGLSPFSVSLPPTAAAAAAIALFLGALQLLVTSLSGNEMRACQQLEPGVVRPRS